MYISEKTFRSAKNFKHNLQDLNTVSRQLQYVINNQIIQLFCDF